MVIGREKDGRQGGQVVGLIRADEDFRAVLTEMGKREQISDSVRLLLVNSKFSRT